MRTVLALLLLAGTAPAQQPPTIERVRVGLPSGRGGGESGLSRNGSWAPVAVVLKAGDKGHTLGQYRLCVETLDADELKVRTYADVPAMDAGGAERTVQAYALPGADAAPFAVRLETAKGKLVSQHPPVTRDATGLAGDGDIVFVTLGASLGKLRQAADKMDQPEKGGEGERTRRLFASIDDLSAMPDSWLGYGAADAVILATSKREFVARLAQDKARCAALREWVLRGGQLVLSVGANRQEAAKLLESLPLVPFQITGGETLPTVPVLAMQWARQDANKGMLKGLEIAAIVPGEGLHSLVRDAGKPVLLEGALGLGRVVVAAFDLDAPAFAAWEGNEAFWTRLQGEVAPLVARRKGDLPRRDRRAPGQDEEEGREDYRARLKAGLEKFEDIVPISFGWVALFILFYILLVGPIDYFLLKRFFKRLELTWITFPIIVLAVSAAAYWAAYSFKGDDQRVNKLDLVEIDLHGTGQAYGHTWLTLFSPRVQAYTVGLSPAGGAWTGDPARDVPGTAFSLLEGGERPRTVTQGLFPRPYEFAAEASGVVRVPVPVWSTRTFAASWRAPLPKVPPVGIADDLGPPRAFREGKGISGKLTNNLGVELRGCTLFYKDRWHSLGTLAPGESRRLDGLFGREAAGQNRDIGTWLNDPAILGSKDPLVRPGQRMNAAFQVSRSVGQNLKHLMFFRAAERPGQTNAGLRQLDQTWRIRRLPELPPPAEPRYLDEAVLVARVPLVSDAASHVASHPATPSRLWLGKLPEAGQEPPALSGTITQETFLRVYIPVK